jgi:hypothetical protein
MFGYIHLFKGRLSNQREQDDDKDGIDSSELSFLPFWHHNTRCMELVHFERGMELREGAESGGCGTQVTDVDC